MQRPRRQVSLCQPVQEIIDGCFPLALSPRFSTHPNGHCARMVHQTILRRCHSPFCDLDGQWSIRGNRELAVPQPAGFPYELHRGSCQDIGDKRLGMVRVRQMIPGRRCE